MFLFHSWCLVIFSHSSVHFTGDRSLYLSATGLHFNHYITEITARQEHCLFLCNIHSKRDLFNSDASSQRTKCLYFLIFFVSWHHITGCSVMNRTYCLLQYFVLITQRLCLLCASPAASSWPSILSGTSFPFCISISRPQHFSRWMLRLVNLVAQQRFLRSLTSPHATSVAAAHSVGI